MTHLITYPTTGIGVRCFPGATDRGGGWDDLAQVRIATDPPVEGVSIYLKAFDPDDPSAKDNVVDGDLLGGDNRDANHHDTAELTFTQEVTMPAGDAISQFRVAHQPGDNHRIAATLKQSALNMLADNTVPPSGTDPPTQDQVEFFIGHLSPLLTVWRKLHVAQSLYHDCVPCKELGISCVWINRLGETTRLAAQPLAEFPDLA